MCWLVSTPSPLCLLFDHIPLGASFIHDFHTLTAASIAEPSTLRGTHDDWPPARTSTTLSLFFLHFLRRTTGVWPGLAATSAWHAPTAYHKSRLGQFTPRLATRTLQILENVALSIWSARSRLEARRRPHVKESHYWRKPNSSDETQGSTWAVFRDCLVRCTGSSGRSSMEFSNLLVSFDLQGIYLLQSSSIGAWTGHSGPLNPCPVLFFCFWLHHRKLLLHIPGPSVAFSLADLHLITHTIPVYLPLASWLTLPRCPTSSDSSLKSLIRL